PTPAPHTLSLHDALPISLTRGRSPMVRTGLLGVPVAVTCGIFAMLRMEGLSGEQHVALAWRWSPTREQLYLTELAKRRPATTTRSEEHTSELQSLAYLVC